MRRAFILAIALHLAGAVLMVVAIRYWPVVARTQGGAHLDLDLTPHPPPSPVLPEPPALEQALAAIPSERRVAVTPAAVIPEARPADIPEPTVMATRVAATGDPIMPEAVREDARALTVPLLPVFTPVGRGEGTHGHPITIAEIKPHYPYAARTRGEAGRVTVHVRVTSLGEVESSAVAESSGFPSLDESALAAARKARFKPAEKGGKAVPADMDLTFDFRLQD